MKTDNTENSDKQKKKMGFPSDNVESSGFFLSFLESFVQPQCEKSLLNYTDLEVDFDSNKYKILKLGH